MSLNKDREAKVEAPKLPMFKGVRDNPHRDPPSHVFHLVYTLFYGPNTMDCKTLMKVSETQSFVTLGCLPMIFFYGDDCLLWTVRLCTAYRWVSTFLTHLFLHLCMLRY